MTTIGNVGASWRASVSAWGAVEPWDGSALLDWWVAADDRWHTPRDEPTVRQRRLLGAPVLETALRVPNGDALQRVYCTADDGGLTVVEIENASPLPFAVAFSHGALLTVRPPADVAIEGIELPPAAVVIPVGHRSVVRVAVAHDGRGAGTLARPLPAADQVARGWVAQTEAGVRIEGFDELADDLVAARATLLLEGPPPTDDPVAFLIGLTELVRLGQPAAPWVVEVAGAVEGLGRKARRRGSLSWDDAAALDGAAEILQAAGEPRAVADVAALLARLGPAQPPPDEPPDGARSVAWLVRRLAVPTARGADLLPRLPPAWRGRNLALYGLPVPRGVVSFALRWHGDRPALLWDVSGDLELCASGLDPAWSTSAASGEALLATPPP